MAESNGDIFQNALSDFMLEAACGGAIRHLADSGYTAKQIAERLDYPISASRLGKILYQHLCDTCVILEKPPDEKLPEAKPEYIVEYHSYGKPSYRRKSVPASGSISGEKVSAALWREAEYKRSSCALRPAVKGEMQSSGRGAELTAFLADKWGEGGAEAAYLSCDFGIADSPAAKGIPLLNNRQREYLEGILWPHHRVYHRLDHRMREILGSLYEQGAYEGVCYFLNRREKLLIALPGSKPVTHDGDKPNYEKATQK